MNEDRHQAVRNRAGRRALHLVTLLLVTLNVGCAPDKGEAAERATYPIRPIRLVVPWPPGGGADLAGRAVAQQLTATLGRQVVVDNRPGASGIIGSDIVAHAQPDGYTLLLPTVTAGINPLLNRKLPYDTEKDFSPIVLVASSPYILAINPAVPAHSVAELIRLAKAKPNELNYASTGNGSAPHLTTEWFKMLTHTSMVHVPYKGGGPALADLIAGQVQLAFGSIANYLPQGRAGKLRMLAITSASRNAKALDLPTMIESGVPGFVTGTWFGLQAPAGTPQQIIATLNSTVNEMLGAEKLPRELASEGADPIGGTPRQFADFIKSELTRWASVIRAAHIAID